MPDDQDHSPETTLTPEVEPSIPAASFTAPTMLTPPSLAMPATITSSSMASAITTPPSVMVLAMITPPHYDDRLEQQGRLADAYAREDAFATYHAGRPSNTLAAQREALQLFARYLALAGVERDPLDLYQDATAWRGMSRGLLLGFRKWLLEEGYAIGSINQRLAIIRQYCRLAHDAGAIADEQHDLIMSVKGISQKDGRNLDRERESRSKRTRVSTKKSMPTKVLTGQAQRLKVETTKPARQPRSGQDVALELRDQLLMGLFIEHAFRVGEVVALNIENFDLSTGLMTVYREKTHDTQQHRMKRHTRCAAEAYIGELRATGRRSGPLFVGYKGKRITRYGLYDRVRLLGEQLLIDHLSPHDLRHYWTIDALANGTPIDRVQQGGNWQSPTRVLQYAKQVSIANEGVIITE